MSSTSDFAPTGKPRDSQTNKMTDTERWASLIGGGALALMGLQQGSLRGALMALAGGSLAYRGATAENSLKSAVESAVDSTQRVLVERTVTIANKSPEELYRFWRNFENLPRFMKHLKSVRVIDDKRSHWVAKEPLDTTLEWDAEIVKEEENRLIAWASVEGADIENSGFVRFQPTTGERGTEVKVAIEYNIPGGGILSNIGKLVGESPEQQIRDELRRFKMLMEAGEIATIEGQPSARI